MSDLIRCDKCKVELPRRVVKKRFLLADLKEYENFYRYTWDGRYIRDAGKNLTKSFHLCKKCRLEFFEWLNLEEVKKE